MDDEREVPQELLALLSALAGPSAEEEQRQQQHALVLAVGISSYFGRGVGST